MPIGIVKWYDCRKGFGFIQDPSGEDVLAHFTAIEGDGFRRLWGGEKVEYEADRGPKGLQARMVRHLVDGRARPSKTKRQPPHQP
jgi:cold shock protein